MEEFKPGAWGMVFSFFFLFFFSRLPKNSSFGVDPAEMESSIEELPMEFLLAQVH